MDTQEYQHKRLSSSFHLESRYHGPTSIDYGGGSVQSLRGGNLISVSEIGKLRYGRFLFDFFWDPHGRWEGVKKGCEFLFEQ